jgi:hypothetical protein
MNQYRKPTNIQKIHRLTAAQKMLEYKNTSGCWLGLQETKKQSTKIDQIPIKHTSWTKF